MIDGRAQHLEPFEADRDRPLSRPAPVRGRFVRSAARPDDVNADGAEARFQDGVLPEVETAKQRTIKVE